MSKKFKKVLVILLSALMVLTYMPGMALTAFAAGASYRVVEPESIPDQVWTGEIPDLSEILSEISVVKTSGSNPNPTILKLGRDYTVEADSSNVGTAHAVFTTMGGYEDSTIESMTFQIVPPSSTDVYTVDVDASKFVYDGTKLNADKVKAATTILMNGNVRIREYDVAITEPTGAKGDAGEQYTVKISKKNGETTLFSEEKTVTILKRDLATATTVTGANKTGDLTYNGKDQAVTFATVSAKFADATLDVAAAEFDVDAAGYENNKNVTYVDPITATITAKSTSKNYTGTAKVTCTSEIKPATVTGKCVRIAAPKTLVYTGAAQTVTASDLGLKVYFVNDIETAVVPESDYDLVFTPSEIKAVGKYSVNVTQKATNPNVYFTTDAVADAVEVVAADLSKATVTQKEDVQVMTLLDDTNFDTYFDVKLGDVKLKAGTDFEVAYKVNNHDKLGKESTIELKGKGNIDSTTKKEVKYTAVATKFAKAYTSAATGDYFVYDGTAKTPDNKKLGKLTVKGTDTGAQELTDEQYRVIEGSYQNNVNAGTATATIVGNGTFEGQQATVEFKIAQKPLPSTGLTVTGIADGTYYVGAEISGATVKIGSTALTAADCTVEVAHITDDFKMDQVTVKGIGNYTGSQTITLADPKPVAKQADLSKATVTGPIPAGLRAYDEATLQHFITVTVDGTEILPGAYHITEIEKAPASATLGALGSTITFKLTSGNAQVINSKEVSFTVTKRNLSDFEDLAALTDATGLAYNGEEHKPGVVILTKTYATMTPGVDTYAAGEDDKLKLKATETQTDGDYTVAYTNNIDAGTATVTITGVNNYEGTITKTFTIAKATIASQAEFDNIFALTIPSASKRQFKPGAPDDLSSSLTLKKAAETVKYEIAAADYTIAQQAKPVKVGAADAKAEIAKTDRVGDGNIQILYTVKFSADSKNYKATPATDPGFTVSYPIVSKTANDAVITLEHDQLVVSNTRPDPFTNDHNSDDIQYLGVKVVVDGVTLERGTSTTSDTNKRDYTVTLVGSTKLPSQYGPDDKAPYVEIKFHNNYVGIDTSTKISIVAKPIDINQIKLIPPTEAQCEYSGDPVVVQTSDIGDVELDPSTYDVVYKDADGEELLGAPVNVGTYTATVVSGIDYGSVEGDSVEFTITQQKINSAQFDALDVAVDEPVEYWGIYTEEPDLVGADADEFKVVSYDNSWDGEATTKGKAVVELKDDSNYAFDGTKELEFAWEPGDVAAIDDVNKFFEIADQEYTGEPLEPDVQAKKGCDMSGDWVVVKRYANNVDIAEKTAVAYVGKIEVPKTEKKYVGTRTFNYMDDSGAQIVFSIKEHEVTPEEEAREDAEWALDDAYEMLEDESYPEDALAKVQDAVDALNRVLNQLPPATADQIYAAINDLDDAMEAAEEAKYEAEMDAALALADKAKEDAAAVTEEAGYPADAVELVNEAVAALDEVLADPDATPDDIADAADDVETCIAIAEIAKAAEEAAEKAKEEAIQEAGEVFAEALVMALSGDYTEESMEAVNDAAANLAEVVDKEGVTASEIKAATEKLQKAIDKAVMKQASSIAVSDVKAVYSGKAPEVPTPIVLGSTGKVSYKFYADAEGKTELAAAPVDAGKYFYKATVDADANFKSAESQIAKFDIDKAASKISKIKPTSKNTKAGKKFTLKATVKAGDGNVTFKKTSGNKKIKVAKSGKVTVKKGLAKGTYKIKVKAKIAKTANYKAASKKATIKITVK